VRVLVLLTLILMAISAPLGALELCSKKGITLRAYAEELSRSGKEVIRKKVIVDIPPDWSIHMGTYEELILPQKLGSKSTLTFSLPKVKSEKGISVSFEEKNSLLVSKNFKLKEIFDQYISYAPHKAKAVLRNKERNICYFSFQMEQGD
jgi:hypothetical protein